MYTETGEHFGQQDLHTLKYEQLTALLTKAIQEQQAEIAALKAANAKLQTQADCATQAQAKLQAVEASLQSLAEQVKVLQASGTIASSK